MGNVLAEGQAKYQGCKRHPTGRGPLFGTRWSRHSGRQNRGHGRAAAAGLLQMQQPVCSRGRPMPWVELLLNRKRGGTKEPFPLEEAKTAGLVVPEEDNKMPDNCH